jgi:hypothetical protein
MGDTPHKYIDLDDPKGAKATHDEFHKDIKNDPKNFTVWPVAALEIKRPMLALKPQPWYKNKWYVAGAVAGVCLMAIIVMMF